MQNKINLDNKEQKKKIQINKIIFLVERETKKNGQKKRWERWKAQQLIEAVGSKKL